MPAGPGPPAHGLRPGDHVAVLLPNDHRTHEVVFGLQRSGVYYTLANSHLTADEAAYIVNDCGAHTLITSAALAPLAEELVARTPAVEPALMVGEPVVTGHTSYDEFVAGLPGRAAGRGARGLRPCCTPRAPPDIPRGSAAR